MPRNNRVYRKLGTDGKATTTVFVVVDNVQHAMSEPAFIEFMAQAIDVMQGIAAALTKPAHHDHAERGHLASCSYLGETWFCAGDCPHHVIVNLDKPKRRNVKRRAINR